MDFEKPQKLFVDLPEKSKSDFQNGHPYETDFSKEPQPNGHLQQNGHSSVSQNGHHSAGFATLNGHNSAGIARQNGHHSADFATQRSNPLRRDFVNGQGPRSFPQRSASKVIPDSGVGPQSFPRRSSQNNADPALLQSRTIRSRLDFPPALTLQNKFGFPRVIVARALRLQFEKSNDDFQTFTEFYAACVEVARIYGIQPPGLGGRVTVTQQSQERISVIRQDGSIPDEETLTFSYSARPDETTPIAAGQCYQCKIRAADYIVYPCGHRSICTNCVNKQASTCPRCGQNIAQFQQVFR